MPESTIHLLDYFKELSSSRQIILDAAQTAAVDKLESLSQALLTFKTLRQSRLRRWLQPPVPPRGIYLWGGVGRGKSLLMDAFFQCVPIRRKVRVHFHAFMRQIHADLQHFQQEIDPLARVAKKIARQYRLICFDEFHVSDIADAMILGRLLEGLFAHGLVFCMTSNYPPEKLYWRGLQRDKFLPAIALLQQHLDIVEVDQGVDYRFRQLTQAPIYFSPCDAVALQHLTEVFDRLKTAPDEASRLLINHRVLSAVRRAGDLVWFDFAPLCMEPRSASDYLELAQQFRCVLVSGIPQMDQANAFAARRFTWLVDVFYDYRIKLILAAADQPENLYEQGDFAHEFVRTVSRLQEMQTQEYLRQTSGSETQDSLANKIATAALEC